MFPHATGRKKRCHSSEETHITSHLRSLARNKPYVPHNHKGTRKFNSTVFLEDGEQEKTASKRQQTFSKQPCLWPVLLTKTIVCCKVYTERLLGAQNVTFTCTRRTWVLARINQKRHFLGPTTLSNVQTIHTPNTLKPQIPYFLFSPTSISAPN